MIMVCDDYGVDDIHATNHLSFASPLEARRDVGCGPP